jgi:hypothetical protein
MGLLAGSATISRFRVLSRPPEPEFESQRFVEIAPGSEVRERIGFVPMELDAPYQVGQERFAFRVRLDTLKPDPTGVKERLRELIKVELESTGAPYVGAKKRKLLRQLAEEELIVKASPRSKIIEGVIDGPLLYVATTAKTFLGRVLVLLRQVGVVVEAGAPWTQGEWPEIESELVEVKEEGQSVLGCRFLRSLLDDRELFIEPAAGSVRLQTREAKVTLTGAVLPDLLRLAEREMELLSAKLTTGEITFRFDGLSYFISGLKVETDRHEHWTELLDERLEKITAAWELLDRKMEAVRDRLDRI